MFEKIFDQRLWNADTIIWENLDINLRKNALKPYFMRS